MNHDALPHRFSYLPFSTAYQVSDTIPAHDVCFVLDAGSFTRIREGVKREEFNILVNIDHHYSNDSYGDYNLVMPEAAATGDVVFQLIKALKVKVDKGIAESIYTSLITDTGRFRYANTTPIFSAWPPSCWKRGQTVPRSAKPFLGISAGKPWN